MPSNTISQIIVGLGIGATTDIRPPVGEAWVIEYVGSNQPFIGSLFLVPDIEISLKKGADTAIIYCDPALDDTNRYKKMHIDISHDVYMTIKNTSGGIANIAVMGEKINPFNIMSDIVTIPGGGSIAIDPGLSAFTIDNIGSDTWTVGPADINPDVTVGFQNAAGTLVSSVFWNPLMICGHHYMLLDLGINHDCQLLLTGAPGVKVGYTGHKSFSAAGTAGNIISFITDIVAGGDLPIRPPDGDEWRIRHFAAEKWAGAGAPADVPDITVSLQNGANLSNILEAGLWSLGFLLNPFIDIDHDNYLNIHNNNIANNEVAVIGYLTRQY